MVLRNKSKRKRSRGCKNRNRKGGKRSKRVKRRKSRKSRKRRRTRRKRKRRRRMKGGSGCPYNKNLGEQFTGRAYNNLSGPTPRAGYISTNNNSSVPAAYQKGGAAAQNLVQGLGLGDLWQGYYGLGNSISNVSHAWNGKPDLDSHKPMRQNLQDDPYFHQIPDVKAYHDAGVIEAANKGTI